MPQSFVPLAIASYSELLKSEGEIIARMGKVPNSAQLFTAHPLLFLREIGVKLSPQARKELIRKHPQFSGMSPLAYRALLEKGSALEASISFDRLFQPE